MASIKKCKGCGQNYVYDPNSGKLMCESCGTLEDFTTHSYDKPKRDLNLKYVEKDSSVGNLDCPNCGAKDCVDKGSRAISLQCKYCGTPLVASNKVFDIDSVVPFSISKAKAKTHFISWAKGRFWAPAGLKKVARLDNFNGYYIPSWAFDTKVHAEYSGTEVRAHRSSGKDGKMEVNYTYHPFSGKYDKAFDNVIVAGNNTIADSRLQQLEPYDYRALNIFSDEYFYGFNSDSFNTTINYGWSLARGEMESDIKHIVTAKYERVENFKMKADYFSSKFARYMVPVWKANYKYKEKPYNVYINGQTGKVSGDSPVAVWKVVLATIIGIAIAGLVAYLFIKG